MTKLRRFRVVPMRTVTLPRSTMVGPNATNVRFRGVGAPDRGDGDPTEFEVVEVDRFIRGRVRAGDLIEITDEVEATTRVRDTPITSRTKER